jgi:enamine deaminase RidA (YjgF/YER057c/UK114 family)
MQQCLESAAAVCEAAGTSLDMMLKRRNFYLDLSDLFATEFAVRDAWPTAPPASSNVGMSGPLSVPACRLAMDMVCAVPSAT